MFVEEGVVKIFVCNFNLVVVGDEFNLFLLVFFGFFC